MFANAIVMSLTEPAHWIASATNRPYNLDAVEQKMVNLRELVKWQILTSKLIKRPA